MELQNIFTAVLNMSLTGSIVILCVLPARLLLKKAPRVLSWMLWLVVLLRLLCPVSVPGPASVLELVEAPRNELGVVEFVEPPVQAPLETIVPIGPGETVQTVPVPTETPIDWGLMASRVWLMAAGGLLAYGTISYVNLKRKLRESFPLGRGVRECDGIGSPFVLGRTVYLPAGLGAQERGYILLHEQLHLRHGDHILKSLFWLAVSLHWFNPLVWLSFWLCGRDMELRCDEAVLRRLGPQVRSDYAQSLLNCAAGRRFAPVPLAFGEGGTGSRVRFVLGWKRSKLWMAVFGAAFCAAVLLLTACDPAAETDSPFGHSYGAAGIYATAENDIAADGAAVYTLTSDSLLVVRQNGQTRLYEALQEVPSGTPLPATLPEGGRSRLTSLTDIWKTADDQWWLLRQEDGALFLWQEGEYLAALERIDLLGVTIRQSGIDAYVEPVWYRSDVQNQLPEEMSVTMVDGDARIILMPELDVDSLLVSEEYYERQPGGETAITVHDHFLERDSRGEFALDVSRRGNSGDDYAIYRVTIGEDCFHFRLSFPAVPGETSVSYDPEQPTREVRYDEHGAFITLQLPETWDYAITSLTAEELDAGITGGITFWPRGHEEGKIFFGFYPDLFAVCGTGLETTEMLLAGQKATVGTYDGRSLWDFIRFGEHFAAWGQGHEAWWTDCGEAAMEILDSAQFGLTEE